MPLASSAFDLHSNIPRAPALLSWGLVSQAKATSVREFQGLERSKALQPSLLPQPGPSFSPWRGVLPPAPGPEELRSRLGTVPTVTRSGREELRASPVCVMSLCVSVRLRGQRRRVESPLPVQLSLMILPSSSPVESQPAPGPCRGGTGMALSRFWKEGLGGSLRG